MSRLLATSALAVDSTPAPLAAAGRLYALAGVLAVAAVAALAVDFPMAHALKLGGVPGDVARFVRLSETFAYGGTVALIIWLAALLDPRRWRVVPRLAISAFGAGLAADVVKLIVARQRPSLADLSGQCLDTFVGWLPLVQGNHRLQSFPSAHTATAVGLAIALVTLYPRGWWLFASLAALAGFQRIESQSHFLSDVLAGAAIGCLVGATCTGKAALARWLSHLETPRTGPVA